jgi:CheY-like chemotaxis protein
MGIWGARVLLVDDDGEALGVASRALQARGADVIIVPNAGTALATVIGVLPDVLVVDLSRAAEAGIGFVCRLRSLSPEKGGQIPALSLGVAPLVGSALREWREAGFQGHFLKPFPPLDLTEAVARWAGQAVERRRRAALDPRGWPSDVLRDRRAELRAELTQPYTPERLVLGTARG